MTADQFEGFVFVLGILVYGVTTISYRLLFPEWSRGMVIVSAGIFALSVAILANLTW